jgi:hypothetical protein
MGNPTTEKLKAQAKKLVDVLIELKIKHEVERRSHIITVYIGDGQEGNCQFDFDEKEHKLINHD